MDVATPEPAPTLEPDVVGPARHVWRIFLLTAVAAVFLHWTLRHSEARLRDGLRSIESARQIDAGAWRDGLVRGMDHPLHPLGIVAMHRLIGGEGPEWWERAAVALGFASVVLLVIPVYLLTRDLFGDRAREPLIIAPNADNIAYLTTKRVRMDHELGYVGDPDVTALR